MLRRAGSPLAIVNALALTLATLLAGAWDSSGHGHDLAAANAAYCAVDHETEAGSAGNRAAVSQAAALHDHSCVACNPGRPKIVEERKTPIAGLLDVSSAAAGIESEGCPTSGEYWQRTARGPPLV